METMVLMKYYYDAILLINNLQFTIYIMQISYLKYQINSFYILYKVFFFIFILLNKYVKNYQHEHIFKFLNCGTINTNLIDDTNIFSYLNLCSSRGIKLYFSTK